MFQIQGERRAACVKLTDEIFRDDKIEPGISKVRRVLDTLKEHSNCRPPQGQYVYEGGGILWAHPKGGKEITSTRKIVVYPKMGATTNHNGAQGIYGSNQFLFLLCPQLLHICLSTNGKTTSGKGKGKKGMLKAVAWDDAIGLAFENLKIALKEGLEVFQIEPDHPFILRTDAIDFALGAVLEQQRKDKWFPIAFYSQKLTKSQKNWTAR
jgi:hypothetical protein